MLKVIRKADIVLFIALLAIGLAMSWFSISNSVTGNRVVVTVDGELYGTYSLSRNQSVTIERGSHSNRFQIKDGQVRMTHASCRNQVCVNHRPIGKTRQTIVCLPNRVVIEIHGGESEYDAISD